MEEFTKATEKRLQELRKNQEKRWSLRRTSLSLLLCIGPFVLCGLPTQLMSLYNKYVYTVVKADVFCKLNEENQLNCVVEMDAETPKDCATDYDSERYDFCGTLFMLQI